jgi:hypothetical protein
VASLVVLACGETVTAPGSCPAFCPPAAIDMVDTVLAGSVRVGSDSVFVGYVRPQDAVALQLTAGGTVPFSRAVIRFRPFIDTIALNAGDTIHRAVAQTDSFKITITYLRRKAGVAGVTLRLYRLLATTDSNVTLATVQSRFDDSTAIGTATLDDTVANGTVSLVVPASAFPTFHTDSLTAAVGVEVRAGVATFLDLGAADGGNGATIQRYIQVDSVPGVRVSRSDAKESLFDTFVFAPDAGAPAGTLSVGGVPSARVMLRAGLPSGIVDSSQIVRATLFLVPVAPVIGAAGDTVVVVADGVNADFGAKSPVAFTTQDSVVARSARALVGSSDTLRIDITTIVRAWKARPTQPHTLSIRVVPEGAGFGTVWVGSTGTAGAQPAIRVTYVRRFNFGSLR